MTQRGGKRQGSGRTPLPDTEKKTPKTIYFTPSLQKDINRYAPGNSFSEKCISLISAQIARRKQSQDKTVKFVDLFAGLGGIRIGFEEAFRKKGLSQQKFADKYHIPLRTLQSWEGGEREPAMYIIELLGRAVREDFSDNAKSKKGEA